MVALRKLPGRSLLSVTGSDARALLRGVLTCDVDRLAGGDSSPAEVNRVEYGALLNSAGRVLYDVFLHGGTKEVEKEAGMGGVIVECSANAVDSLADALRRRTMLADVTIKSVPARRLAVAASFASDGGDPGFSDVLCNDPRAAGSARRGVVPAAAVDYAESFMDGEGYRAWRYGHGMPCGPSELPPGVLGAFEVNLDALGGLRASGGFVGADYLRERSSRKGGRVKRRVMPVVIEGEGAAKAAAGDEVVVARHGGFEGGNGVGRLLAAEDGRGLALLRLDRAMPAALEGAPPLESALGHDESWSKADPKVAFTVKPTVPSWWPRAWYE